MDRRPTNATSYPRSSPNAPTGSSTWCRRDRVIAYSMSPAAPGSWRDGRRLVRIFLASLVPTPTRGCSTWLARSRSRRLRTPRSTGTTPMPPIYRSPTRASTSCTASRVCSTSPTGRPRCVRWPASWPPAAGSVWPSGGPSTTVRASGCWSRSWSARSGRRRRRSCEPRSPARASNEVRELLAQAGLADAVGDTAPVGASFASPREFLRIQVLASPRDGLARLLLGDERNAKGEHGEPVEQGDHGGGEASGWRLDLGNLDRTLAPYVGARGLVLPMRTWLISARRAAVPTVGRRP